MNISSKCHALIAAALICGLATQANLAFAGTMICDAVWPNHVRTCNSNTSRSEGNSLNSASNKVLVQAFAFQGTVTEALALSANGTILCSVSATPADSLGKGKECTVTTLPTAFRVIGRS